MAYFNHANYDSGTNLSFEVEPDIGRSEGKEYKTDSKESYGGVEYITQAHTGKKTWAWNWSNVSISFRNELETFRNTVGGNYKSFTYNDGTTSYTVRMGEDSLQFRESNYRRYSTNIKLREVSPS